MRKGPSRLGLSAALLLTVLAPACAQTFDTSRAVPERGSIGEEMYGVICDRIGAQELREDLTGASFHDVCHRSRAGAFADTVDTSVLPSVDRDAVNKDGVTVTAKEQRARRQAAVARIEALARRRDDLVRAFDATFPKEHAIPIKDLQNRNETLTCEAHPDGTADMPSEFAAMLGRFTDLYNDGTLPQSTESLATVVDAFRESSEAQKAWSRLSGRKGYRPVGTSFGVMRPVMGYPYLRDLGNATLRLLSADSNPYELNPQRDENGNRVPVPGPVNAAFERMLEVAHAELANAKVDPADPPLTIRDDLRAGRSILSRPRDNLEMLSEMLYTTDEEFSTGTPSYIVKRDARGFAALGKPNVQSPFVDKDGDGFGDVDERGRLMTANGTAAPTPFPESGDDGAERDAFGRATSGGDLLYSYLDTSRTFAARVATDVGALARPEPRGALLDLVGGLHVAAGARTKQTRQYADGLSVSYDGVPPDSPLIDLVYAVGVLLGDRHGDTTLALVHDLLANKPQEIGRLTGALMESMDHAHDHPEAKIPREATFWDESIDTMIEIAKEPGLLEDVLTSLADPDTAKLGVAFSKFAQFKDQITYDKSNLNGAAWNATSKGVSEMHVPVDRSAPITGENRSAMYRFLSLISDTTDVTACNKQGAKVHAKALGVTLTLPLSGTYRECEVFKIENLAKFYLDAIAFAADPSAARGIGRSNESPAPGTMYLRDGFLRNGVNGLGAATVDLMEESSGITGFWTDTKSKVLAPQPKWLNRLVFFDFANDNVNTSTKTFLRELAGEHIGSSVCPERVIDDPVSDAPDTAPDRKVRGLRNCADGQWLQQRGPGTIFTWEQFGFYDGVRPLLTAFVKHKREDLFLKLSNAAYRHLGDENATVAECLTVGGKPCARSGAVSYEPLLAEVFATDVLSALGEVIKALSTLSVTACEETDESGACTLGGTKKLNGLDVVAELTRSLVDPAYAKSIKLTDRHGNVATRRNDGTPIAQVTPAYLLTNALSAIDLAYDTYEAQHPDETDRRANWRRARSLLADQFMATVGAGSSRRFTNPTMTKMAPKIVDLLRAQLNAHCPKSFEPPYEKCTWAIDDLAKKATETLGSPITASGLDVMDGIRKDEDGTREVERLIQYVMDAGAKDEALANTLASANDILQVLRDEENLVPIYHLLAATVAGQVVDKNGKVVQRSLVDAQMALLAKVGGRYFDAEGQERCNREIDPNAVLSAALGNLVKPIETGASTGQTPLDIIMDVIADLNRVDPGRAYDGTLEVSDYVRVSENITDFLLNKERGLEQFYEVIRRGTK